MNVQQLIGSHLQRYAFAAPGGNSARFYPAGQGASRLNFPGVQGLEHTQWAGEAKLAGRFRKQMKRRHIQRLKQEHKEMSDKLRDSLAFLKDINQKLLEDDAARALVFQHVFMMRLDIDDIEREIMEIENSNNPLYFPPIFRIMSF